MYRFMYDPYGEAASKLRLVLRVRRHTHQYSRYHGLCHIKDYLSGIQAKVREVCFKIFRVKHYPANRGDQVVCRV